MKLSPLFLILAASILVPTAARAQQKASSAEAQMKMIQSVIASKPSQPDVEVDMVPAEEASNCKMKDFQEGDYVGNEVDGPDGNPVRVLCRRKESSGAKNSQAEQIRFYNKGVEVFRDDYVTKESSWLGDAGSRRGIRGSAGIEKWVYISPEEATAEMVAALASGDEARYRRVALSADDIKSLGISDTLAEELTKRVDSLGEFKALADRLAIPEAVRWAAFNGNHQALLPKGRHGLKVDLPAYINATVVLVTPDDSSQSHQLYVGDMVRVGEVWKIIGLPTGEPFGQAGDSVSVASILFPSAEGQSPDAASNESSQWGAQLSQALGELETASPADAAALCEKIFNLYMYLGENIKDQQTNFIREAAVFLQEQVQNGRYPAGVEKLTQLHDLLAKQNIGRDLVSFVGLRQLMADYYASTQKEDITARERFDAEDAYHEKLAALADEYPRTPAAAEALRVLAQDKEYVQENDAAINLYQTIADDFSGTLDGQRAAGALARLSAVGKPYQLPEGWKFTDGSPAQVSGGKRTVIFGWSSWLDPEDFRQMKKIMAEYPDLEVIGVALEGTPEVVQETLQEIGSAPWKNVFIPSSGETSETGESPAAIALGAQNAPLIILIGEDGNLLVPNIVSVADLRSRLADPVPSDK